MTLIFKERLDEDLLVGAGIFGSAEALEELIKEGVVLRTEGIVEIGADVLDLNSPVSVAIHRYLCKSLDSRNEQTCSAILLTSCDRNTADELSALIAATRLKLGEILSRRKPGPFNMGVALL